MVEFREQEADPVNETEERDHKKDDTAADAEFMDKINDVSVISLHRSNLLRLQMEQLVEDCALSLDVHDGSHASWASHAQEFLQYLSTKITAASKTGTLKPDKECPFVFQSDRYQTKTLEFSVDECQVLMPSKVQISTLSTPAANAHELPTLPLTVLLPDEVWEDKDYMRHRCFDKLKLFAWHVAKSLEREGINVTWEYEHADNRIPCLMVTPPTQEKQSKKTKKKKKQRVQLKLTKKLRYRVQIHFGAESLDWITTPLRLLPNRCNLRGSVATPYYNNALVSLARHKFVRLEGDDDESLALTYPSLRPALLLIQVWCLKRGLLRNHDGWILDDIRLFLVYMFRTKQCAPRVAAPQVLAAFFRLIVETNWCGEKVEKKDDKSPNMRKAPGERASWDAPGKRREALVMPCDSDYSVLAELYKNERADNSSPNMHEPESLLQFYQSEHFKLDCPVFLDSTMTYNYFGRLSLSFVKILQRDARLSLDCLQSSASSQFNSLFKANARFWERFDTYMTIPLADLSHDRDKIWCTNRDDLGNDEAIGRGLTNVLYRALGDRVHVIRYLSTGNEEVVDAGADTDGKCRFSLYSKASRHSLGLRNDKNLVLGFSVNPMTCFRVIDRGPSPDKIKSAEVFTSLWGTDKSGVRRFKDGAIVHAVVWESSGADARDIVEDASYVAFANDDRIQGSFVERIVRHMLKLHFLKVECQSKSYQFELRRLVSLIDSTSTSIRPTWNPTVLHRGAMKAFDELSEFLKQHSSPTISIPGSDKMKSKLGIPLAIDRVEPISPALRYTELFPQTPHPLLGAAGAEGRSAKVSRVVMSSPIDIQIRFGDSSKWPRDLNAIKAAKTAMLVQLLDGIETMKRTSAEADSFDGEPTIFGVFADVGFKGLVFRLHVRADPEMKLVNALSKDTERKIREVSRQQAQAATHHTLVHSVFTSQPSASFVVRLARRWLASHLLSDVLCLETIELLVCHVYSEGSSTLGVPGSALSGFRRFLELLFAVDWKHEPLLVDPKGQFSVADKRSIQSLFELERGPDLENGPSMYVVAPLDRMTSSADPNNESQCVWSFHPCFASSSPEPVLFMRLTALARRTSAFLHNQLLSSSNAEGRKDDWFAAFQESDNSFFAYDALLRVDEDLCVDADSSSRVRKTPISRDGEEVTSTYMRSMQSRYQGPSSTRIKVYRNLQQSESLVLNWKPVAELVRAIRSRLGHEVLCLYNEFNPRIIALLYRPQETRVFSVANASFSRPAVSAGWKSDSLIARNPADILREIQALAGAIVVDVKILDQVRREKKRLSEEDEEESD